MHLIRHSLDFTSWKDRKAPAGALKPICTAVNAGVAAAELDAFEAGAWGAKSGWLVHAPLNRFSDWQLRGSWLPSYTAPPRWHPNLPFSIVIRRLMRDVRRIAGVLLRL